VLTEAILSKEQQIKVFVTQPHPCSYLSDRAATTLFIDPNVDINKALYSRLSELGFRRSGEHVYKPQCGECQACVATRIPSATFVPSKSQKRVLAKNKDVAVNFTTTIAEEEYYQLYQSYINEQHSDGDMYPPNREQYDSFLNCDWDASIYMTFRLNGRLIAVAVTDLLADAMSAIYTFYDPTLASRSLGTFCILSQIKYTQQQNWPYLYLGYWIKQSPKMDYKTKFRPLEVLKQEQWQLYIP
jgi:arginine-tRNA-protein transferase